MRQRLVQETELGAICEALMERCLAPESRLGGVGCDNMTVVLVVFLHGGTMADVAARCSRNHTATQVLAEVQPAPEGVQRRVLPS